MLNKARRYLQDILGSDVIRGEWGKRWLKAELLPFFLQDRYTFYPADLFGQPCLLMVAHSTGKETPAVVRKHWQTVSKHFAGNVIYLVDAVDAYSRKRLIEQGVPFLVPGNQLYLPMFGIDLREYFRARTSSDKSQLSIAAQLVILRQILHHDCAGMPAKDLAAMLAYSQMTVSRAIRELTEYQLVEVEAVGREKHLRFPLAGPALWERAHPLLQSPVKKRIWIAREDWYRGEAFGKPYTAGEAALAYYTLLADSTSNQWAMASQDWTAHKNINILASGISEESASYRRDKEAIELELWAYSPRLLTRNHSVVDPLSLWLSFEENTDERMEMAREDLLEQVWRDLR